MAVTKQYDFLQELQEGMKPTVERIRELLHHRVEEDLHLDYKAGAWLDSANGTARDNRPPGKVRRYIAGFANAEGGVLVIGVAEDEERKERELAPVTCWSSGEEGEKWLARCASALRPFLSPPPRFHVLEVEGGGFLAVIVAPRSYSLVVCEEGNEVVHYFRLHDQTMRVPSYLVQDLVLGRRQQPVVELGGDFQVAAVHKSPGGGFVLDGNIWLGVTNAGLVWIEAPVVGLVFPGAGSDPPPLTGELIRSVQVGEISPHNTVHFLSYSFFGDSTKRGLVEPFGRVVNMVPNKRQIVFERDVFWRWRAAATVLSLGKAPLWFQVEALVEPLSGDRYAPRVSWDVARADRPEVSLIPIV